MSKPVPVISIDEAKKTWTPSQLRSIARSLERISRVNPFAEEPQGLRNFIPAQNSQNAFFLRKLARQMGRK